VVTASGTLEQRDGSFSSNCEQLPLTFLLKFFSTKNHKKTSKPLATRCSLIIAAELVYFGNVLAQRGLLINQKDALKDEGEETAAEREISEYMLIES